MPASLGSASFGSASSFVLASSPASSPTSSTSVATASAIAASTAGAASSGIPIGGRSVQAAANRRSGKTRGQSEESPPARSNGDGPRSGETYLLARPIRDEQCV